MKRSTATFIGALLLGAVWLCFAGHARAQAVTGSPPVITSIQNGFGSTSATFNYQITATENPTSFGATGLPAGLSLNAATGMISGTPTVAGTFSVTLSATNPSGSGGGTLMLVIAGAPPTLSQEYVLLHSFNDGSVSKEGVYPGQLIQGADSTWYGVTAQGGASGSGTIFHLSAAGSAGVLSGLGEANQAAPQGLVPGSAGNFYGTTQTGGSANLGTVFVMTPQGVVTVLHSFGDGSVANDGAGPQAGVIEGADGAYYGTTQNGGSANLGTVFKITSQGVLTILHSFGDGTVTNDGAGPVAAMLQLSSGIFYGTTQTGGSANSGTVFAMTPQGAVSILHNFADGTVSNDGYLPHAALIESGGNLFGTTFIGGSLGKGTVFQITTAGVETILHNFGDGSVTNDGINPLAPLVADLNGDLFGTTQNGGSAGFGAIFEIDSSGNCTIIHSFQDGSVTNDGANPVTGLQLGADGNLYGTTLSGGVGYGSAYAIAANLTSSGGPFNGVSLGGGWYDSSWFGYYNTSFYPWIYQTNLGFLYLDTSDNTDLYLYVVNGNSGGMGWLYTTPSLFPSVYSFSESSWLYYSVGGTSFYNWSTQAWENY